MSREKITPPTRAEWIPNTFVTPNVFVDKLMPLLEPEEYVVLSYAAREIFGWHKREDRISIKQFCKGKVKKETGEVINYGTGMSIDSVRSALDSLHRYGILIKVADNDPRENKGALYTLSPDGESVDWNGLLQRYEEKLEKNASKVKKARDNRGKKPPAFCGTEEVADPFCGSERAHSVGQNAPLLSYRNTEIHDLKPDLKPSMHANDENSEDSEPQPTQTGMDACMDGIDQEKFNFLWDCGLRSEKLINDLVGLPMQTLEKEWALVKNSTNANDKPALLGRNLRIALTRFQIEQRQAAERAANPAAAQVQAPSNAHPDAQRYQRPDFITEAEWYGLRDMAEVYAYLDGAIFDGANGIVCRNDRLTSDLYMKMGGAVLHTRLSAIRDWQPQEDWA